MAISLRNNRVEQSSACAFKFMRATYLVGKISHSTILLLALLYMAYVASDYISTQWLIANDPAGIANETNPLARLLYNYYGLAGMLAAKSIVYLGIAFTTVVIEARYEKSNRIKLLKELTLLALIGYSLVVVVNNSLAVFVIGAIHDPAISTWMVKTYGILFSITLTALISLSYFAKSHRRAIEVIMAVTFLLLPIWILDKFYPLVFQSYWSTIIFSGGLVTILAAILLLQNKFRATRVLTLN